MLVKELMSEHVITVTPDTSLQELAKMLKMHKISGIPVVDNKNIVGMVTLTDMLKILGGVYRNRKSKGTTSEVKSNEGDVMTTFQEEIAKAKVSDVMSTEVVTLREDSTLDSLIELMDEKYIHTFPVVKEGRIIGVVGKRDLVAVAFPF